MRVPRAPLLLLFVLSGAAGLIYEVVWARQLVLVFGNTSQAVSTILTGFFGGLAIGGVGRRADRRPGGAAAADVRRARADPRRDRRPHPPELPPDRRRVPRDLPGAVGHADRARAGAVPARDPRARAGHRPDGRHAADADPVPVDGRPGIGKAFQQLYAANTVGAILGTAIAGFALIELFGLTGALLVGAACSATAGVVALLLDRWVRRGERRRRRRPSPPRRRPSRPSPPRSRRPSPPPNPARSPPPGAVARLRVRAHLARLPGGLEPAARRRDRQLDVRVHDHPGRCSWSASRPARSSSASSGPACARSIGLIAIAQLLTAAFVMVGAAVLASPPDPLQRHVGEVRRLAADFARSSAIVVLPPTIIMGLTFPATAALLGTRPARKGPPPAPCSRSTRGAIVATFVLPFFVIPLIGSPATLALLAIINVSSAACCSPARGRCGRRSGPSAPSLAAVSAS